MRLCWQYGRAPHQGQYVPSLRDVRRQLASWSVLAIKNGTEATKDGIAAQWRGQRWYGQVMCQGLTTTLPPNAPVCSYGGDNVWGAATAQSNHSGGANAAMLDGSVRFVSETVDCGAPI